MNEHRSRVRGSNGLPTWLNITVVLNLLALFSYNVVFVGEKAYPTNVLIFGLLGGYVGVEQVVRWFQESRRMSVSASPPPDERVDPS